MPVVGAGQHLHQLLEVDRPHVAGDAERLELVGEDVHDVDPYVVLGADVDVELDVVAVGVLHQAVRVGADADLRQQRARPIRVVAEPLPDRLVEVGVGAGEEVQRGLGQAAVHLAGDAVAVEHRAHRLAEPGLAEPAVHQGVHGVGVLVEGDEGGPQGRTAIVYGVIRILGVQQLVQVFGAQREGVFLAFLEQQQLGVPVRHDLVDEPLDVRQRDAGLVFLPVVGVALHHHAHAGLVLGDVVLADRGNGRRVGVDAEQVEHAFHAAVALGRFVEVARTEVHVGGQDRVGDDARVVERHRALVDLLHLDARLGAVRHLDELAGVAGLLQLLVALDLVVPEHDVVGGDLHPGVGIGERGPVEVVAQGVGHRERVGLLVHLDLEAGQVGDELAGVGVVVGQRIEQHADHGDGVAVARQQGVEALGVVVDRAEPSAADGAQLPFLAAGAFHHLGEDPARESRNG